MLTVARIKATAISSKIGQYRIEADSFIWDRSKENFKKPDSISEKAIYVSEKTGKEITNKDLIPDEGSLLGIQQVIQQSILDQAKEPEKIIDAVLTMDRISYDSKMTYTPDELTIVLPKNSTGTSKVTLKYKDIAPFIDTDLVSQESIKDTLPALDENKKYVALTFDDGPNNSSTLDLLNILKTDNVKATFFMLGQMVDQNPDVAKQVHDGGHEVASHSYSLSTDELQSEMNKTNKAISKLQAFCLAISVPLMVLLIKKVLKQLACQLFNGILTHRIGNQKILEQSIMLSNRMSLMAQSS